MKDILKKYRKHKLFSNLNIVLASLVLAIGINFFLVDGTDIGQSLKASVLNTQVDGNKSDISIEKMDEELYIIANSNIKQLNNLSFSLTYNPQNIDLLEVSSSYGDIVNLSNIDGFNSIILSNETPTDIKVGDKLVKIYLTKKEEGSENLNIINANFTDGNGKHKELSTSGLTF